ncbi:hypothetical protein F5144DRAFT_596378 [Chaetomium tenue]|uniref:Uncharacterized protein n=1 Tax=Chaetomium tenue TaxID=1854479 RepID=A0ACB7NX93_9PEZI|nr:hypothetical protein F5144DRAFT_596378 [Chaetomium globosum]
MCKAIIGHCQCMGCLDQLVPGSLRRVDFCDTKQEELAGLWIHTEPERARTQLIPCKNLTFQRVGDPDACHSKGKKKEGVKQEDANKQLPVAEGAQEIPTEAAHYPTNRFTPINAAQIARAAMGVLETAESGHAQGVITIEDDVGDADDADDVDDSGDNMDIDSPEAGASAATGKLPASSPRAADSPKTRGTGKAVASSSHPSTPTKINKGKQPATTTTNPATPWAVTTTPTKRSTPYTTTTGTIASSSSSTTTPTHPHAHTTPTRSGSSSSSSSSSSKRTPLPTTRPSTPRVRQAEAAFAAAELADRVSRGAWTHEETVKLLLLRGRGVGYEDMREFLPGRDAASCLDRLAGLAVKHGSTSGPRDVNATFAKGFHAPEQTPTTATGSHGPQRATIIAKGPIPPGGQQPYPRGPLPPARTNVRDQSGSWWIHPLVPLLSAGTHFGGVWCLGLITGRSMYTRRKRGANNSAEEHRLAAGSQLTFYSADLPTTRGMLTTKSTDKW